MVSALHPSASRLLEQAGLSPTIISLEPCAKSGNNRTYQLTTRDGRFALKQYFTQAGQHPRLSSEFSFLKYAKQVAPHCVPTPYSADIEAGMALYEFIEGTPLRTPEAITASAVEAAIAFFCALNQVEAKVHAVELLNASEACFSLQTHLDLVAKRLQGLQQMLPSEPEDEVARQYIEKLSVHWQQLMTSIHTAAREEGLSMTTTLTLSERCISPSDFGFHNALQRTDGTLCFLDFEYAGWDDPAKMISDFFLQPAVPVPMHYWPHFAEATTQVFSEPAQVVRRAQLLRGVYQIKWCCIVLNVFIPEHLARRLFANPELKASELKKQQLLKAKHLIESMGGSGQGESP